MLNYPDRRYTQAVRQKFTDDDERWWRGEEPNETARIRALSDRQMLTIEMDEAASKWQYARGVFESKKDDSFYSRLDAKRDVVRGTHRYFTALEVLSGVAVGEAKTRRRDFWIFTVGGFIIGAISAAAAILALLPYFRK